MNDQLLFRLADTFGVTLHKKGEAIRGFATREFDVGGTWLIKSDVTVCVDESSKKLVTAFARIANSLWMYAVITEQGSWLLPFDGQRAKIRVGAEKEFGTGDGMKTLKKLKHAIVGAFSFTNNTWTPTDPDALVADL